MTSMGKKLAGFHFTPGTDFEDAPVVDVVNSLIGIDKAIQNSIPIDPNDIDGSFHNPPHTELEKRQM